ncbi:major facilitator superfamily domain-containing protein [Exophiala viscosa]|uniref:major facilitator superfamily domain-containing protein n=1 Tax=Exophiala viscosa TaxID=2486360 RepID=UPI00219E502B|nr:major facilitator superfamily domain-containing protein [Exophiala viscosa]
MAELSNRRPTHPVEGEPSVVLGQPREQLAVEENAQPEDDIEYPTGYKLWLTVVSVGVCFLLKGLDLLIVAVTIPSLTNQFKTLEDIGWYSSIYGIILSASTFFFGKAYTVYDLKSLFMISLVIFEGGSLLCTLAYSSKQFILGRALAGLGASGLTSGGFIIITHCFPVPKRPMYTSIANAGETLALVSAPMIGGALIDAWSWRACFGINLPLGVISLALFAYGFNDNVENPDTKLPFREKWRRIDPLGTLMLVPAVTCLMIATQWGGITYGWGNFRIILLIILAIVLFSIFAFLQYRLKEEATIPPRLLKNRSIMASSWFCACTNGTLAVTEYCISIYLQGVRGYSPAKAGLLAVPMMVGLCTACVVAGAGTTLVGYYTPPVAAGLLTTLKIDDSLGKIIALLGFLGAAIGIGAPGPSSVVQTSLPAKDISIGISIVLFGAGLGSSLFVSASSALFRNRLVDELHKYLPNTTFSGNSTTQLNVNNIGLSEIQTLVGPNRLKDLLLGYDEAVIQTLYLPVALAAATVIGSALTEWRSVKTRRA